MRQYIYLRRRRFLLIILFVAFSFIIFTGGHFLISQFNTRKQQILFSSLRWNLEINLTGGETAYQKFKQTNINKPPIIQHEYAHNFGLLLYNKYGLKGILFCDDSFNYGCFHVLTGMTILREGLSAVDSIINECRSLPNSRSCQHGIGHGLLAYFGYNLNNLDQALGECGRIEQKYSETRSSGVFMEFNFQNMHTGIQQLRKPNSADIIYPCNSVKTDSRPGCFFQQTQWWLKILPGTNTEKVQIIDKVCINLTGLEAASCYRGLAYHLGAHTLWNAREVKLLCNTLGLNQNRVDCLIQAADIFSNGHKLRDGAREICGELKDEGYLKCIGNN